MVATATASRVTSHESRVNAFAAAELKAARRQAGFTQAELASELALAVRTIRHWEQGRGAPSPHNWYLLAATLRRHGIEFPFPPEEDGGSQFAVHSSQSTADATAVDVNRELGTANRELAQPGGWADWLAWRRRCKLDGGRWHHRPIARGVQVGLCWNAPFAWEMSLESVGPAITEHAIDRVIRLLFGDEWLCLYATHAKTGATVVHPSIRIAQHTPHLARLHVRTSECSLRWEEIRDLDVQAELLITGGAREALS